MPKNNLTQPPDFEAIAQQILANIPHEVSEMARIFFRASFENEGFTDYALIKWPQRKDTLSHKILSLTHALKNSIIITQANRKGVQIEAGKGIPYAEIHNTGGVISVRITEKARRYFWYMYRQTKENKWKWMALTKKERVRIAIPQRQYIGESQLLLKDIDKHIAQTIVETFKNHQ